MNNTTGLYIIIFILSLLVVIFSVFLFYLLDKKLKDMSVFIFIYILSIITSTVVAYLWFINFSDPLINKTFTNFQPLISPTVTTLGLIITVGISYMTIRFNQKKMEIDLIYSLIKDQRVLIQDETVIEVSNNIKERCLEELTAANIAYIRIVKFIKENQKEIFNKNYLSSDIYELVNTTLKKDTELISDRKIEQIVLSSWRKQIQPSDRNLFRENKIAKTNTIKKLRADSPSNDIYKKIGAEIFKNSNIEYLFNINNDEKQITLKKSEIISKIKYEEAVEIINNIYRINYYELGHMFKNFHRIIRIILEGLVSKDTKVKNDLLGILRAQFPENILVLMYYNASYTYRGYGLGCLLQGTKFFGDHEDFETTKDIDISKEKTHISSSNLYFTDIDNKIIQEIYGSDKSPNTKKVNKVEQQRDFINKIKDLHNTR